MFNPPPADLDRREPLIYVASTIEVWWRCHKTGYHPVFFGRNRAQRWDAPKGDYGILYLGADERCAFMESMDPVGPGFPAQVKPVVENSIFEGVASCGLGCVGRVDAFGGGGEFGERPGISQLPKMVGRTQISPGEA